MKTIFNASYDEVKELISKKEIEDNSGKIADYITGKAVDKYEQERKKRMADDYFDLKKHIRRIKILLSYHLFYL